MILIKFKSYKVDFKRVSIFFLKTKFRSIGFFGLYKLLSNIGVSIYSKMSIVILPLFVIRCINYTLTLYDSLDKLKMLRINFKLKLKGCRNLRSFLFRNNLPCNGQRTKTNAQTAKKRK